MKILIEDINRRCLSGENIILDICLSNSKALDGIHAPKVSILVYAPISVLAEREKKRHFSKSHSRLFYQKRKAAILSLFHKLYRIQENSQKPVLDELARKDVEGFLFSTKTDLCYPALAMNGEAVLNKFRLKTRNSVPIIPAITADLVIDTNKQATEDSVEMIVNLLREKNCLVD